MLAMLWAALGQPSVREVRWTDRLTGSKGVVERAQSKEDEERDGCVVSQGLGDLQGTCEMLEHLPVRATACMTGTGRTRFGAAHPMTADRAVIVAKAASAPEKTVTRECFIAMMAAMKKVLSPISDARIIPHDLRNPCFRVCDITICCISSVMDVIRLLVAAASHLINVVTVQGDPKQVPHVEIWSDQAFLAKSRQLIIIFAQHSLFKRRLSDATQPGAPLSGLMTQMLGRLRICPACSGLQDSRNA